MALPDRPPTVVWKSALSDELLTAIGHLAVVSGSIEEQLHRLYWRYAGLTEESGPIVTNLLPPKRLAEDLLKIARLNASIPHVCDDLKLLMDEFTRINEMRNQCVHWMWIIQGVPVPESPDGSQPAYVPPYKVMRPAYRQKGIPSADYRTEDVEELVADFCWLKPPTRESPYG